METSSQSTQLEEQQHQDQAQHQPQHVRANFSFPLSSEQFALTFLSPSPAAALVGFSYGATASHASVSTMSSTPSVRPMMNASSPFHWPAVSAMSCMLSLSSSRPQSRGASVASAHPLENIQYSRQRLLTIGQIVSSSSHRTISLSPTVPHYILRGNEDSRPSSRHLSRRQSTSSFGKASSSTTSPYKRPTNPAKQAKTETQQQQHQRSRRRRQNKQQKRNRGQRRSGKGNAAGQSNP